MTAPDPETLARMIESRRAEGGGRGRFAGGAGGAGAAGSSGSATLWILDSEGVLDTLVVRTGLSDGQKTAVYGDRLEAGMQIIAAVTSGTESGSNNPFQSSSEQRRGPPGSF